jgi:PAS domain S-box-containing protein
MSTPLRILNIEDSISDAELMRRSFKAAGYDIEWAQVETGDEMRSALAQQEWDVILADYRMPQFDAMAALRVYQQCGLDIPFIVVSGAIGEDLGVAMMKAGAHDYMLKGNIARLVPAVEREIRDARVRRGRRQAEERYRRLAEVAPHLVWQSTADGRIEYANQHWREYFGREPEGFTTAEWPSVIHPDDVKRVTQAWQAANSGEDPGAFGSFELRMRRHDGAFHWFLNRSAAVRDADGNIVQWFGMATDIHELKQAHEELSRANENLRQFSYAAAHDLLEPLRNIRTSLQLLERLHQHQPEGDVRELISQASGDAQRLHTMLRSLYELTKVAEGSDPTGGSADANEVMRQVLANVRTAIAESGAEVVVGKLPSVPMQGVYLLQLLQNLVGNALKFRDKDRPPRIEVTAEARDGEWLFTVSDNGIGFDPAQSERIFEIFKKLHDQEYSGDGVGLAICARIVVSHGGRIWAEGKPGEGAKFRFTLPARRKEALRSGVRASAALQA